MNQVILGLGTNLGEKKTNLEKALSLIETHLGKVIQISSIYETEAWGVENQDNYYNIAITVETQNWPISVLNKILEIEKIMGRIRNKKWESRIIDIDILFFNDISICTEGLIIPHPLIHQRRFVLAPLMDLNPKFIHPKLQISVENLFNNSKDNSWIKLPQGL